MEHFKEMLRFNKRERTFFTGYMERNPNHSALVQSILIMLGDERLQLHKEIGEHVRLHKEKD